ncbi:MAG TPA: excinuclease ABC subunit UvrA [Candidatus Binataceae bacterium]
MERSIVIRGARTNNLQDLDLDLPLGRLSVVTGVSGSGKSSLVFDTVYAEGQRRYVQSLSTYARLFLDRMQRPDVDIVSDIPPALALRQKNAISNARSSVGSITEINDYLRLLFGAIGRTICPQCDGEVARDTVASACDQIVAAPAAYIFTAPFKIGGSRPVAQALSYLAANGYHRLLVDGEVVDAAAAGEQCAPDADLAVVIDRVVVGGEAAAVRVREALEKAFYLGAGQARAVRMERAEGRLRPIATLFFDRSFNCSRCATTFPEPTPALLSANSPIGACPECQGFGRTVELDLAKVIPNHNLSIRQGLVAPWRTPAYREMHAWMLECARRRRIRLTAPYKEFTAEERTWLLDGESGERRGEEDRWPGIRGFFKWMERRRYKTHVRILLARYRKFVPCAVCGGAKLRPQALNIRIHNRNIADLGRMPISALAQWIDQLAISRDEAERSAGLMRELRNRIGYLTAVGLGYLTLDRAARTLSGGEAQRIHLASALGSRLTSTLYALDEPTVGLHARDSRRLLGVLRNLRDLGNTVVVVEHDPLMVREADHLVELGPGGGRDGGSLVYAGSPAGRPKRAGDEPTGRVFLMRAIARERRLGKSDPALRIIGAAEHNLKDLSVSIPLGRMVCITGVSGSGKSTLVEEVLYNNYLARTGAAVSEVGACRRIEGLERLERIVHMGQEGLSRSTRSNPATYTKLYDSIRKLFAATQDARRAGIEPKHFSFNVAGGRCERCHGMGVVTVEMHFMADLEVKCEACDGRRFQSHVLGVKYRGLNIKEVLALTIDEARGFFSRQAQIVERCNTLSAVGLGYLELGQATSTLSGGEAQRLRLSAFLMEGAENASRTATADGKRMFILDEPTTGLAGSDIRNLLRVFNRLIGEGHTLLVIEHNLELIANADFVIDLGPEGGAEGGRVVASGTPLEVAACEASHTGRELRRLFGLPVNARSDTVRTALRKAAGF